MAEMDYTWLTQGCIIMCMIVSLAALTYPMFLVNFLICIPFSCKEWVFLSDDLSFKESDENRELICQALDLQVATHIAVLFINMLH